VTAPRRRLVAVALGAVLAACTVGDLETLAQRAVEGGRFAEAQRDYERLASWHPERDDYQLWIARLAAWQRNFAVARARYEIVRARDPKNVEALVGLADVATWTHDFRTAHRLLHRARHLAPDDPQVRLALAQRHRLAGDRARAMRIVAHVLRRDPGNCAAMRLHDAMIEAPEDRPLIARLGHRLRRTLCNLE
jgi:cytochrome c-type biogenesis protein CcmH/NrfG